MKPTLKKKMFYGLLNEGLYQKYCLKAGSIQELAISYKERSEAKVVSERRVFEETEIVFIGNFIEEKLIYADNLNPISLKTELHDIEGTLFVKDNQFEDLILEVNYETI